MTAEAPSRTKAYPDSRYQSSSGSPAVGIEHEYAVVLDGRRIDFRRLFPQLKLTGQSLDPRDGRVTTPSGVAIGPDGIMAEVATPPIPVGASFANELSSSTGHGYGLLRAALDPRYSLVGESTHINVGFDTRAVDTAALLFTQTFAIPLMLLLDQADSPGLLVRPRLRRLELCGEFAVGDDLAAAAVLAVAGARACLGLLEGELEPEAMPPAVELSIERARRRFGWYVDRSAAGADLYEKGRETALTLIDGSRVTAQELLALAWRRTRHLVPEDEATLALVDDRVSGRSPLPLEVTPAPLPEPPHVVPLPSRHGLAARSRKRERIDIAPVLCTWEYTVFELQKRRKRAFVSVPDDDLPGFISELDSGHRDRFLATSLRRPGRDTLVSFDQASEISVFAAFEPGPMLVPVDFVGVGRGSVGPIRAEGRLLALAELTSSPGLGAHRLTQNGDTLGSTTGDASDPNDGMTASAETPPDSNEMASLVEAHRTRRQPERRRASGSAKGSKALVLPPIVEDESGVFGEGEGPVAPPPPPPPSSPKGRRSLGVAAATVTAVMALVAGTAAGWVVNDLVAGDSTGAVSPAATVATTALVSTTVAECVEGDDCAGVTVVEDSVVAAPPDCADSRVSCVDPAAGASCSGEGYECQGTEASCTGGAVCGETAVGAVCSGAGTTCLGAESSCSDGALCGVSASGAVCSGDGAACQGAESVCADGAICGVSATAASCGGEATECLGAESVCADGAICGVSATAASCSGGGTECLGAESVCSAGAACAESATGASCAGIDTECFGAQSVCAAGAMCGETATAASCSGARTECFGDESACVGGAMCGETATAASCNGGDTECFGAEAVCAEGAVCGESATAASCDGAGTECHGHESSCSGESFCGESATGASCDETATCNGANSLCGGESVCGETAIGSSCDGNATCNGPVSVCIGESICSESAVGSTCSGTAQCFGAVSFCSESAICTETATASACSGADAQCLGVLVVCSDGAFCTETVVADDGQVYVGSAGDYTLPYTPGGDVVTPSGSSGSDSGGQDTGGSGPQDFVVILPPGTSGGTSSGGTGFGQGS